MRRNETCKEVLGLNRITKKRILELCRKNKLYQTPELNDVLYLHYQGFDRIEYLEDYTELKCLWLECNAISEIQGLDSQTKLKCLFLQSNLITKIENLEHCKELDTLNLSQNHIRKIENCGYEILPLLNTLNVSSNYLKDCECLQELRNCKNLSVLDLSNNRIDDILIVKIFSQMPELKVLVLQGNPVVSKIPQYRKTIILECKKLTYLDSRPVFPKDRACAEAWKTGGYEAERKENEFWNRQERKKMRDSVNATIYLRNKHRQLTDQIELIPSSDSEEDTKDQKRDIAKQLDSKSSKDNTWDEVTEKKLDISLTSNASEECKSDQSRDSCCDVEPITDGKENIEITEDQSAKEDNIQDMKQKRWNTERALEDGLERKKIQSNLDEKHEVQTINHNDIDQHHQQDNYNNIIKTIEEITQSENASESFTEDVEIFDSKENEIEDNYELLKELDETMDIFSKKVITDQSSYQIETTTEQSTQELSIQEEYLKVNNQFKSDFEELSSNMSNFVNQLEREQEERQEVKKILFCEEKAAKESSSECSDNDYLDSLEKLKFERITDRWDKETKIKHNNIEYAATHMITKRKQITVNAPEIEINENVTEKADYTENETIRNSKMAEKKDKGSIPSFEYIPLDMSSLTHKSMDALNTLEKESKILKNLLQKLENNNENIFKDISLDRKFQREDQVESEELNLRGMNETVEMFERNKPEVLKDIFCHNCDIQENKVEEEATNHEENQKELVEQILEEILQPFDIMYIEQQSYEFPPDRLDMNEEISLSYPKSISKSIPDAIKSFNDFFNEININQRANNKSSFENIYSQQDKSLIFKELPIESKIQQLNSYTLQNLDEQLEEIRRNQHEKVGRMVDRVYAQKDQYNDTLELVDGKLMMRNQYTKELRELPQPSQNKSSDSEEDYDTAESEDEGRNTIENLGKSRFRQRFFKPKTAQLSEDLITHPVRSKSNDSDESNEEFFSFDCQVKPNLYNIDKEFLNKLKFDEPNLTQIDENHIVQCATSYEKLKHYLTINSEETMLTELEQEMLDNMIKSKHVKINGNPETLSEYLQNNSDLTKQEQLWVDKMALTAQETKRQDDDKFDTNESEKFSGNILRKTFLNDILEKRDNLNDTLSKTKCFTSEQLSEEEKNEIENNIDFESCETNTKITGCGDMNETFCDNFEVDVDKEIKNNIDFQSCETNTKITGCGDMNETFCDNFEVDVDKEIKNNIDFQSCETNTEITDCGDMKEIFFDNFEVDDDKEIKNNIDFEGCETNTEITDCGDMKENFFDKFEIDKEKEIKNNIEFESCETNTKITDCGDMNDKFEVDVEKEILTECTSNEINVEESVKTDTGLGVLECNLEIIGDNDEIVDTIAVQAELHF